MFTGEVGRSFVAETVCAKLLVYYSSILPSVIQARGLALKSSYVTWPVDVRNRVDPMLRGCAAEADVRGHTVAAQASLLRPVE